MKYFFLCTFAVLLTISGFSQPGNRYSSSDKKAIKYYEEATSMYDLRLYGESLSSLEKAIGRDPHFIEPHVLKAQIHAEQGDNPKAISALEGAIAMNPEFFPNNYHFLGELCMLEARYADAEKAFATYMDHPRAAESIKERTRVGLASSRFAQKAIQAPVPFEPVNLGPGINTEAPEYYPSLTADGETILFTRLIENSRAYGGKHEDFYVSAKDDAGEWLEARNMGDINTLRNEGAPSLSADGQTLIFTACEGPDGWGNYEGLGRCDLFVSQRVGERWTPAQNIRAVNSFQWDSQPSFSADGRTLYFIRGQVTAQGVKNQDIWVSRINAAGAWSKPIKIPGLVNTAFEEESVMIHPDGETLYFSSNGHPGMGGLDIFVSKKQPDGEWGKPVNLGYPINTAGDENSLLVAADGEVALFASDREGGFGDLDLYSFVLPVDVRPGAVSYLKGVVYDALSYKKLEARFELIDLATEELTVESYSNSEDGSFLVSLPPNREYALNVSRPGYMFYSEHFTLTGATASKPFMLDVPLKKIKPGNAVVLNNVFFDTDSYELKPSSEVELYKLLEFMEMNQYVILEVSGHTDNVGSDDKNQVLSENRAKAVVEFLSSRGIAAGRLKAKGYGETKPVADNSTEAGRAKNRRTEVEVISN